MFEPFLGWAARRYQARVAVELKKYGLRYEDLLDPLENLVSLSNQSACQPATAEVRLNVLTLECVCAPLIRRAVSSAQCFCLRLR